MLDAHQTVLMGALRPTESRALPQDPNGKGRSNRSPSVWMRYVDPPPETLPVSRPYKDSYDSSVRPMGVASQNSTLPCAIATFPVSLRLSPPGDVWPRLPLLPSAQS